MLTTVSLAESLRVSIGRLARKLRQQSLGGLTPSQTSILFTLDRHGAMSMSQLAELESISKPSATGIVGRLFDKGLLHRSPDPGDGRSSIVDITSGASRLLEQRRRERTAYLANRIDALDEREREILERAVVILEGMIEDR